MLIRGSAFRLRVRAARVPAGRLRRQAHPAAPRRQARWRNRRRRRRSRILQPRQLLAFGIAAGAAVAGIALAYGQLWLVAVGPTNPVQIQKFLRGIDYPADKQTLVEC